MVTAAPSKKAVVDARPKTPGFVLRRPHLEERLDETFGKRLALVVAGAGYGKSTLVGSWSEDLKAAWHTLGPLDHALGAFTENLLAALARAEIVVSKELAAAVGSAAPVLDEPRRAQGIGALLCEWLSASLPHDLMLVIDDLHEIDGGSAAIHLIETLCRQAPEHLHLVLVSREEPPFPTERLRGQGHVVELAAVDLVLRKDEIAELARMALGGDGSRYAPQLHALTGGWPAAARMAIERMRHLPPEERQAALAAMAGPRGPLFSYLAEEVLAGEAVEVRSLLRTVAPLDRFTAGLCQSLGLPEAAEALADLGKRGLFVQERGEWFSVHPLVREFTLSAWDVTAKETREIHRRAAAWLEANGNLEDALASLEAASDYEGLARLISLRGADLIAAGSAEIVIHLAGLLPENLRDTATDRVLGEAYAVRGEPELALAAIGRAAVGTPLLDPAVAWRLVQTYHLRDSLEEAVAVHARTRASDLETPDRALLYAWTASAYRRLGDMEACRRFARRALEVATVCRDDRALAAAHTASSFASEPDRHTCRRHLKHALEAAERAGDVLQIIRIRNNRGSLLLEESDYVAAIAELERAMHLADAVGYAGLRALTLMNRGLAHWCVGHLDDAKADYETAVEIYRPTGSQEISYALIGLGDVHRERGDLVLARAAYEEGLAIGERSGDLQSIVPGLYQLAKVLVDDEPERAAQLAARAVSFGWPDPAWALNAAGWIALVRGDRQSASETAERAGAVAREAGDRFGLAESLELEALSTLDSQRQARALEGALAIWRELGNGVHEAAVELARARLAPGRDARIRAERAARRLRSAGVRSGSSGAAGLLRFVAPGPDAPVAVETLGAFRVLREGRPVEHGEWQSKKARDLLKILVSRRGRPVPREVLTEALWPRENPAKVSNRLSVALSTVRSVLDPEHRLESDHYVRADSSTISLRNAEIDVEEFLAEAEGGLGENGERLEEAEALYAGDFLEEDPYEDWAAPLREESRATYIQVARALARRSLEAGELEQAARYLRRILERDPYDEKAHLALVAGLASSGQHGEARRAYQTYVSRMAEIAVEPTLYPAVGRT
jgi:ATP/maltotriose-dependent transcriptional regulator MalT/DNA-binding SARP family transcriptional activator